MKPSELFYKIRHTSYSHIGKDLDYQVEVDDDEKAIRVFFQESHSKLDWLFNLSFPIIPTFINGYLYWFSMGWWITYSSGRTTILADALMHHSAKRDYRIEVCGYSLGGFLAVLFGIDFYRTTGIKPSLVTFGAPKGIFGLISWILARVCFTSVKQYAHKSDIVTWCVPFPGYHALKNIRIGKFSLKGLFDPYKYHQIYDDESLYKE